MMQSVQIMCLNARNINTTSVCVCNVQKASHQHTLTSPKRNQIKEFDKTNSIIGIHTEFASNFTIQFQENKKVKKLLKISA